MKKLLLILLSTLSLAAVAAAPQTSVPIDKQLQAACTDKVRQGLGRTRIVDIDLVQGSREKDVRFGLVDGNGNKSTKLCQVQKDGTLKIKDIPVK